VAVSGVILVARRVTPRPRTFGLLRRIIFSCRMTAVGQSATPTFATGVEEVASIADAGGHGTRFAAEPCPQYPSKPPPGCYSARTLSEVTSPAASVSLHF
jgi:hypothetical protein